MPEDKHTVEGVEIFAAGTWTDSQGQEREWTESDLDKLLKNFKTDSKDNPLPLKVGHTDDTFNARIADELGIPGSLLTGDDGNGAARLGRIVNVRKEGSTILADFEDVPNVLTEMIKAGLYNAVSVEIDMPDDDDPHLTGIAILGAELPAIDSLKALDTSNIFSNTSHPWVTLSFQEGEPIQVDPAELAVEFAEISDKIEELIKGKKGARFLRTIWNEVRRRMSEQTGMTFSASSYHYSAAQWSSIIEEERKSSNIKLPIALVAKLSQEMAGKMGMAGMDVLKIKNFEIPDDLKISLMSAVGEPDDSFFDKCMAFDFGIKGMEKLGFCAWLTKEYTGKWPNLDNGGRELPEQNAETTEQSENNKFNIQEELMEEFVLAPEDLPRLYEALGLDETATIEDVLMAIAALKGEEVPPEEGVVPGGEVPGLPLQKSNDEVAILKAEVEAITEKLNTITGFNAQLEHEKLVRSYALQAESWTSMTGTPQDMGTELAEIHEESGEKAANRIVLQYQAVHNTGVTLGITKSIGANHREDSAKPDNFHDEVEEYAEKHDVSFEKALTVKAQEKPIEFAAYTERVKVSVNGGGK